MMPNWYYEKRELRNTPSSAEGIDFKTEMRYRKEGARFIIDTGMKMDLGYNTTATGVVYFHRFYMFHSFKQFPRYVTACCCLFLAGKVEETPKKCKDIIKIARNLLTDQKFMTFGEDPKEEVMTLERILLQTIKFDLQVEHPYSYLLKYAKSLKGDKVKLQKMVQMAWTFVNDSLCTTLCLQWEPEIIAVALMYLAGKLSKFEVVDWVGRSQKHLRWWDMFVEDITMDLLEDICHQVLDLYSQPSAKSPPQSPPPSSKSDSPSRPKSVNGVETRTTPPQELPPVAIVNTKVPPPLDIPQFPYQTFTHAPPPLASFGNILAASAPITVPPPHLSAPPPHLSAPPPVSSFPPAFSTQQHPFVPAVVPNGPPPSFFTNPPPTQNTAHMTYYPPT